MATPQGTRGPVGWRWSAWRLVAATVLLVALVVVVGVGTFSAHWRVCEGPAVLPVCRPLGWGDPLVGLGLVLALVIGFPDLSRVEVGPQGLRAERDPGLSPNADLERRVRAIEEGKVPEWYRETGGGEADDDGRRTP